MPTVRLKCSRPAFEHRRAWIREQLALVASVFAVEACAYAIMSNRHHLVVKLDPQTAAGWSEEEVLERWCQLFSGSLLVQRLRAGERLSEAERRELWVSQLLTGRDFEHRRK